MAAGAAIAVAGLGFAAPAAAAPPRIDAASIEDLVSAHLGVTGLTGVAVAVTHGGEVTHAGGYGHTSEGGPVTEDTLMRIGSVSKSFTALAVMQLVDAGEIGLDEPVATYLPDFATADGRDADITVRHLLNHTSGLSDAVHPESGIEQPDSLAEAVAALREVRLADDPGSAHHYHNPNYQVAARIVEVVSGRSFEDYLREQIFAPAGMEATSSVSNETDPVPGLADGYNRWFGLNTARDESDRFVAGSAGIVSTAEDLASWLIVQNDGGRALTGERLAAPGTVQAMHEPSGQGLSYGLGWDSLDYAGVDQVVHTGSSFTYTSEVRLLPGSGYGFAVLSNSRQPLEAETEAIMDGLVALSQGREFASAMPLAFIWDLVLTASAAIAVGLTAWRLRRARPWAARRAEVRPWRIGLIAAPPLAVASTLALLPVLATLLSGRDVTWTFLWHLTPTLPASLGIITVAGALTAAVRLRALPRVKTENGDRRPRFRGRPRQLAGS
ncbi:beta-lactamase family protein [Glycomyces sp. A-F 0318]|uniref:serine hydrolase domain-containing protein n=1 Tax=Glycomyces amatae TaxID=2881355 RepID=UPI001E4F5E1E|nr:serine hydrolase domain-containing protein [Glycomyces amatae]MCD0447218.1 beta-lactamase family protein [Glycomyces amatae]